MEYYDYEYRVIYRDTDKMGVSYYANYFVWFEAARTEYFRALGYPYTECEKKGIYLPVVETHATYHGPSAYDDLLIIRASVAEMKSSSLKFEYRVLRKGSDELLVSGYSVHVFVNERMRPTRVPQEIREAVTLFAL